MGNLKKLIILSANNILVFGHVETHYFGCSRLDANDGYDV